MIEVWRGIANTWECDEMGHMNVRHYISKAWEGLATFGWHMGLSDIQAPEFGGTLRPVWQHVRYKREVRPGQPVFIRAGIISIEKEHVTVHQEMVHARDGVLAAVVRSRLAHVDRATGLPFAFNEVVMDRAAALTVTPDAAALPRSIDPDTAYLPDDEVTLRRAEVLKVPAIGRGSFHFDECGHHGVVQPDMFMGRISDSVPNLMSAWRNAVAERTGRKSAGAAVLELRLIYRRWPKAGDLWQLHSALGDAKAKTHRLVHWMLDPVTGEPWMTGEAVAVTFDLDERKAIETPPEALEELKKIAPTGLRV